MNIDPEEVEQFNAIADKFWDKTGPFKPLHVLNPVRLEFIQNQVSQLKDLKILDVGCGGGILSEALALHGAKVTGVDAAKDAVKVAQDHAKGEKLNIDYVAGTVESFAENSAQQFDIITCMELLEHVPDPQSVVSTCAKLLKPGGKLFLSTINRTPQAYVVAILGAEYVLQLIPKNTHQYDKFITPAELEVMLNAASLSSTKLSGVRYIPFIDKAALTNSLSVNYLVSAE